MGAIAYKGKIYGGGGTVEDLADVNVTNLADGDILEYDAETEKWKNSDALSNKVDKVTGKGLSANDYTTTEKNKLAGIETGAQVNPTIDSALSDSSTNAVQNKIIKGALDSKAGREEIPTVNDNTITIQLNGTTIESFTLNQATDETINIQVTKSSVGLDNVPNVSTNNQTPTFTQASTRANIASGEKLSVIFGKIMKFFADLKAVAFSGSYTDLSNQPTIPTKVSQLTNDSGYTTNTGTVTQVKVGSTAYNPSSGVISLPAYPTDTNTHRPIQMNGTEILGNNTTALNLKAGSNVSLSNSSGTVTIAATNTDKVKQTGASTNNSDYEVLFSYTADNTTRTEGARKNNNLLFNPSTGNLQATKFNGYGTSDSTSDIAKEKYSLMTGNAIWSYLNSKIGFKYKQQSVNIGNVNFATWASPIKYYDYTFDVAAPVTDKNSIMAISHNNQFWVVNMTGTDNSKTISARFATVASSAELYFTVWFY